MNKRRIVTSALGVLTAATGIWAVAPVLPLLVRERDLASDVESFAQSGGTQILNDAQIRSALQGRARKFKFHLDFSDIFVGLASDKNQTQPSTPASQNQPEVVTLSRVGYTLPMTLPFFGFWNVPTLAIRVFEVKATPNKSE